MEMKCITFKFSALFPNSWLYKLNTMRRRRNRAQKPHHNHSIDESRTKTEQLKSPTIQHYSTNRISHYIPSRERAAAELPLSPTHPSKLLSCYQWRKVLQKRVAKREGLAESLVVVKSSSDPKRDFRESMADMIVENRFFSCEELEELLACYLFLNSSELHDLIVEVFEEIWFDLYEIMV